MKLNNLKYRPEIYILVGLPGSGKSTWIKNFSRNKDFTIISSDDEIDKYATQKGLTYSEVFDEYKDIASKKMNQNATVAIQNRKNIIWDQTNLSSKKRTSILNRLPKEYRKICVVFEVPLETIKDRLEKRYKEIGKYIPWDVVQNMLNSYVPPTIDEGFDEIINIK